MVRVLALDLGKKRTGVAFFDERTGVPLPLDTIVARDEEDLLSKIGSLVQARSIDSLVIGLPFLPSGKEGSQALWVRSIAHRLEVKGNSITFIDERYSTTQKAPHDPDALAAMNLLQCAIGRGL